MGAEPWIPRDGQNREGCLPKDGAWRSFPNVPHLLQYVSNGNYYGRIEVDGKTIREAFWPGFKAEDLSCICCRLVPARWMWSLQSASRHVERCLEVSTPPPNSGANAEWRLWFSSTF